MKLSHPSHSSWKSTKNVDSHITHRTTTTDISTLHKTGHLNFVTDPGGQLRCFQVVAAEIHKFGTVQAHGLHPKLDFALCRFAYCNFFQLEFFWTARHSLTISTLHGTPD